MVYLRSAYLLEIKIGFSLMRPINNSFLFIPNNSFVFSMM